MTICKANKLNEHARIEMSKIFVEGFYIWLKYFSKSKEKLTKLFLHIFNLDVFYVAMIENVIVGIAACTNKNLSVNLQIKEFRKYLGLIRGSIAYKILKKQFEERDYPFDLTSKMGSVEFVATKPQHRKKGVAYSLIKYIITNTNFKEYVLEVADTNIAAIELYKKLNFEEVARVKEKHSKQTGINYLVYMKHIIH